MRFQNSFSLSGLTELAATSSPLKKRAFNGEKVPTALNPPIPYSPCCMKSAFGKIWNLEQNGGSIIGGAFKALLERNKASKPPRDPWHLPKPKGQTVGSL